MCLAEHDTDEHCSSSYTAPVCCEAVIRGNAPLFLWEESRMNDASLQSYATRPWAVSYPPSTPLEIDPSPYGSLGEMIEEKCRDYASRVAYTCMGKHLTYAQLEKSSRAFACYLQSLGLEKGDRVALMMPNILPSPVALFGVLRAGMTAVNINPLFTPRELALQLKDSGAKTIVVLENFAHTVQRVKEQTSLEHVIVVSMGDLLGLKRPVVNFVVRHVRKLVPRWQLPTSVQFQSALRAGRTRTFRQVGVVSTDVAFLQYTGGTTGVSKAAMLTHANILANVQQNALWVETAYAARGKPDQIVFVCALALYHIFALTVNAIMGLHQGGRNILVPNPRDIAGFVQILSGHKWHFFAGLTTLFNALLNNKGFAALDFSDVKLVMGGGMAVQRSVAERWKTITGSDIYEGYGLTETSPVTSANRFDLAGFTGTVGMPLPSTEIAIRDDQGSDLGLGKVGEICIRGPQVMAGYWNRPDETAKVMTQDGFFRSGDLGVMDTNGIVRIVDRKKDMILVSGFNVYPNEIEDVAAAHPEIIESAAIGVPDEHSGEAVKLFVVRRTESLTETDVRQHCAAGLTNYKRPKHIEFRSELPKSNVGKILRRELR
jgi:long-chain acyl-CoA synthetase